MKYKAHTIEAIRNNNGFDRAMAWKVWSYNHTGLIKLPGDTFCNFIRDQCNISVKDGTNFEIRFGSSCCTYIHVSMPAASLLSARYRDVWCRADA